MRANIGTALILGLLLVAFVVSEIQDWSAGQIVASVLVVAGVALAYDRVVMRR